MSQGLSNTALTLPPFTTSADAEDWDTSNAKKTLSLAVICYLDWYTSVSIDSRGLNTEGKCVQLSQRSVTINNHSVINLKNSTFISPRNNFTNTKDPLTVRHFNTYSHKDVLRCTSWANWNSGRKKQTNIAIKDKLFLDTAFHTKSAPLFIKRDFLALTETWSPHKNTPTPAALSSSYYVFSHSLRASGCHGGIGILISSKWRFSLFLPSCPSPHLNSMLSWSLVHSGLTLLASIAHQVPLEFLNELDTLIS